MNEFQTMALGALVTILIGLTLYGAAVLVVVLSGKVKWK